ncbi:MAG: hypothetical protein HQL31_06045, partial [Planctomycetes bacterium]|nr:hypothetical protein [Planctomycetota bacterium]
MSSMESVLPQLSRRQTIGIIACVVVMLAISAIFFSEAANNRRGTQSVAILPLGTGPGALVLDVMDVDPVIAQQYGLPNAAGVLVNDLPTGNARNRFDLMRGDIILEMNGVPVQSFAHLSQLMAGQRPGNLITLVVFRAGASFSTSARLPKSASPGKNWLPGTHMILAMAVIVLCFLPIFMGWQDRTVCLGLGASAMMALGSTAGFYSLDQAISSIQMGPIFIIIGMSIFAALLDELSFFELLSLKALRRFGADRKAAVLTLIIVTYACSLFINNLAAIMVMIPLSLHLCKDLNLNPIPLIVAEIIAA